MTKEEVFNLIRQRLSFGDELQQQLRHVDKDKFMKEHRRSKCRDSKPKQDGVLFLTMTF